MTDEQNKINQAFERFLPAADSYLSKRNLEGIIAEFGAETASRTEKIYREAINVPVDWRAATIDSALPVLHEFLKREYPWLSEKSRSNINYAFIMTWK